MKYFMGLLVAINITMYFWGGHLLVNAIGAIVCMVYLIVAED